MIVFGAAVGVIPVVVPMRVAMPAKDPEAEQVGYEADAPDRQDEFGERNLGGVEEPLQSLEADGDAECD